MSRQPAQLKTKFLSLSQIQKNIDNGSLAKVELFRRVHSGTKVWTMRFRALVILGVTLLVAGFFSVCKKESPTSTAPPSSRSPTGPSQVYPGGTKVGEIAADFSATDQNDHTVTLYQNSGKVTLINFSMANWCQECRIEAGYLEALFQKYKDKGFQIITLLMDGSPADWASQYELTFPVLDDSSNNIWNAYGEGWIPLNIVLDSSMTIRYKEDGYDEPAIITQIEKYL